MKKSFFAFKYTKSVLEDFFDIMAVRRIKPEHRTMSQSTVKIENDVFKLQNRNFALMNPITGDFSQRVKNVLKN